MTKEKLIMILIFMILGVLLLSIPATYIWSPQVGAILRWIGLALGGVYLIVRSSRKKDKS